ncbi:hypothetical protein DRQ36_09110, partial [bacterium]
MTAEKARIENMKKVGITTTIPQEIIWASGNIPVDLNNIFIESPDREKFLARAYKDGYPRTSCPWIAGIYGAVVEGGVGKSAVGRCRLGGIDALIVVTQGDCSNTHALAETLEDVGIRIIPFAYPYDGDAKLLEGEMRHLAKKLGAKWENVLDWFEKLEPVRKLARRVDDLTWLENKTTGRENHRWLVAASDFEGDIKTYSKNLSGLINEAETRKPL